MSTPERLLKFGLSLTPEAGGVAALPALPECFELLELPGMVLDEPGVLSDYLGREQFAGCDFRNLIPAKITREVTDQNPAIAAEYKEQLRRLMALAHEFGASGVGLDPDWEMLCDYPAQHAVFNDILCSTAGDRAGLRMDFQLTVRIPGTGSRPAGAALQWLNRLVNDRVKLALEINPHELLNREIDWSSTLTPFRFEVDTVRLCYESELGNRLLYQHVAGLLEALRGWRREVAVYLAPSGRADYDELAELAHRAMQESA
ncbi:hypothetical protein SDC9_147852 [bioreactor metagenome]|uniref:Xylose isomerase-like TIM barrel domain-containing protein n=1 Tax=bioreactor metagenome TaxID=1076179 RepID=A0A645EGT6_9ZZZZ